MEHTKVKIWKKIEAHIETHHMLESVRNVVAGVSGGADSMCMLHCLWILREKYGYALQVVHVHHGIRGKAADDDLHYVENYCAHREIPFRAFYFDVPALAKEHHLSGEEMGRILRYKAFGQVLEEIGGGKIAVAHNSDDNSETVLMNLFRGTGIKGLSGIRPVRDDVIRPVLCLSRTEILEYLKENGIDYIVDMSNLENVYTRNKIRNHILPYVQEHINERASEHIFRASESLYEICCYMEKQADRLFETLVTRDGDRYELNLESFCTEEVIMQKMIVRRILEVLAGQLKDITAVHIADVLALVAGETGKQIQLPYRIVCQKKYQVLEFTTQPLQKADEKERVCVNLELEEDGNFESEIIIKTNDKISLKMVGDTENFQKIEEKIYTKWLDYDILKGSLQIRNRENGDYIVVNRQGGKKKIKDYFIDLKIPRDKRDEIILLARGKEVFWIIGYRISERCKVTEHTRRMLELEYHPYNQKE